MKILDRYVILTFLKNYLISFFALVGMTVVMDMMVKLNDFVATKDMANASGLQAAFLFARAVADYYVYQVPLYFMYLSGIIPIVAAAFTLLRMVRFNELSALLSAGVPLLRVAAPMILAAMLLQGLLWVDLELVIPNIIPKLVRTHDEVAKSEDKCYDVKALRDGSHGKLFAGLYYPSANPPRIEVLDVLFEDEQSQPTAHLRADLATWDEASKSWKLVNGRIDRNISPDRAGDFRREPIESYQSSVTPTEIALYRNADFTDYLATSTINELLKRPLSYGRNDLLRVKHTRASQMITNMVVLLLAIASVLTREANALKYATIRCCLWCASALGMTIGAYYLAGNPPLGMESVLWPAMMAWMPVFVFGPLAVWLLDRVKT